MTEEVVRVVPGEGEASGGGKMLVVVVVVELEVVPPVVDPPVEVDPVPWYS